VEQVLLEQARDDVGTTIRKALSELEYHLKIGSPRRIVIKPNLGNPFHVDGVTTHPEVVVAVVEWLRDRFADVAVVESDGIRYSCDTSFEAMGLTQSVPAVGGRLVNLSKDPSVGPPMVERGAVRILLPKTLHDADMIVSAPVLKTHELTTISCSVKNLFGCVPSSTRIRLHPFLSDVLADLYVRLKPRLVVGDAIDAMHGNGPIHGDVRRLNLLTFGTDCLTHDSAIARLLYGTSWERVEHLKLAAGKTNANPDDVRVTNRFGELPQLSVPQLDIVARTMALTYRSQGLTSLLYLTPMFPLLNRLAWSYRAISGKKPKFELHY